MATKGDLMKRLGLLGAGAGFALFAIFGLLQGALIGGAAGLAIANYVFGAATFEIMANDLLPRIIVAASMVGGVLVSMCVCVVACAGVGVAAGYLIGLFAAGEAMEQAKAVASDH